MNRQALTTEFKTKAEKCALDIIKWLIKHEMWIDTFIYVNGKRYGCWDGEHYHYENTWEDVYVEDNMDPNKYFEYNGDFLSMSFEGPLYEVINEAWSSKHYEKLEQEFSAICEKYNKYYELGNAWNCSLFDL